MRISKNKFIKLIPTSEHEFKALEEYLEEKSLEGWMLEDIKYGFLIFKKKKPKKCKFTVNIFTDNNKDEYIEYCEALGWKYLFQHDEFLIFYTEEKTITPIQTDEEIIFEKVRKPLLKSLSNNILIIAVLVSDLLLSEKFGNGFFSKTSENSNLLKVPSLIIIILCILTNTIIDGLWYFKSSKAFKLNEDINYPNLKSVKVKNICSNICMCFLVLMIIIISTNIITLGKEMTNYVVDESHPPMISISDLVDIKTKKDNLHFNSSKSFLSSSYTYSYEGYYNDPKSVDEVDNSVYLDYEICKSKYQWVIDKTFKSYLKKYDCEEVKDDNWDALAVYKFDELSDGYLLKYKDRVMSISGDIDFSKKNIEFIKEKCINW